MCGIAGQVRLFGESPITEPALRAMADCLAHRGPDDWGTYIDSQTRACGLAHRRLSIIDLSPLGHQPLCNEDRTVWVAFNGEVYNFQQLRPDLEQQGHVFRSHSDTEALVHLWEQHGPDMVRLLRGMFAFAIWDQRAQTLFLARDRLGKKPLFYGTHHGVLRFGSELKALMADPAFPRRVNQQAVLQYLTFGYVPHPSSILESARKLPPAHWLLVRKGTVAIERYWSPPARTDYQGTFEDAKAELREQMIEATRLRMIADVPLGAFLSGGIDSTIVVGLMAGLSSSPVKTFSIGFEEERFNETPFARQVAQKFGTDHHEFVVKPDALEVLPLIAHHYDEPFNDASAIPTYYVSKMTRQHVTVALTGDAGDEMFAGYDRYRVGRVVNIIRRIPFATLAMRAMRLLPESEVAHGLRSRLRRLSGFLLLPHDQRYFSQMRQFAPRQAAELLHADFVARVQPDQPGEWFCDLYRGHDANRDPVSACSLTDYTTYLVSILNKVDIASMAVSLECRSPFLDHHVVELASRLPARWRMHGSQQKYILKQAFADLFPEGLLNRPKAGFSVPLVDWFRGPLREMLRDTLLSRDALDRSYFNRAAIEKLIDDHEQRRRDNSSRLWTLLMLEQWHRTWLPPARTATRIEAPPPQPAVSRQVA